MKRTPDESFDPEALDDALDELIRAAQDTRDSIIMGDEARARVSFAIVIHQLSEAVGQFSLLNRK